METEPEKEQGQGGTIVTANDDDAKTAQSAAKQEKAVSKTATPVAKPKQQVTQEQQPFVKPKETATKKEVTAGKTVNKAAEKSQTEKPRLYPDMTNGAEIIFDDMPATTKPTTTGVATNKKQQGSQQQASRQIRNNKAANNRLPLSRAQPPRVATANRLTRRKPSPRSSPRKRDLST